MLIPMGFLAASGAAPAGAYELISTTLISTDTASVTFSSIPAGYKHLQVRWTAKGTSNGPNNIAVEINGVTSTGSYYSHEIVGAGSGVNSYNNTGQNWVRVGLIPGPSDSSGIYGNGITEILDFASTTKTKTLRTFNGYHGNSSGSRVMLRSSLFDNTSAITQIKFLLQSGNIILGSRFSIYGVKGA
jgi:hypothetical protein